MSPSARHCSTESALTEAFWLGKQAAWRSTCGATGSLGLLYFSASSALRYSKSQARTGIGSQHWGWRPCRLPFSAVFPRKDLISCWWTACTAIWTCVLRNIFCWISCGQWQSSYSLWDILLSVTSPAQCSYSSASCLRRQRTMHDVQPAAARTP